MNYPIPQSSQPLCTTCFQVPKHLVPPLSTATLSPISLTDLGAISCHYVTVGDDKLLKPPAMEKQHNVGQWRTGKSENAMFQQALDPKKPPHQLCQGAFALMS